MDDNYLLTLFLKKVRTQKCMTQEELAEKASINEKHYGRIERGENSPSMKNFFKICNALNIKYSQFMLFIENYDKSK